MSAKSSQLLTAKDIDDILSLVYEAGTAVMEVYRSGNFEAEKKDDDFPVTAADKRSNEILLTGLAKLTPEYKVVSEEGNNQETGNVYWLVDPLDGTTDFLKQNDQFAIMLALMKDEQPVFGIVYAPALELTYYGGELLGESYRLQAGDKQSIQVAKEVHQPLKVTASLSHRHPKTDEYLVEIGEHELVAIGSGLKFCYVADGSIDLYVRYQGTMEWDTAAPQAILEAAGGKITWEDKDFHYGKADRRNTGFFAKADRN